MALFTREDLEALLAPHSRPCVSLFLPTHRRHPDAQQDPIRFRNLLKRASELVSERYSQAEVKGLLEPLQDLLDDTSFWLHQKEGLAVFRSDDLLAHYRLPLALPELAVAADSFHVRPMVRFLEEHRRFFALALSQKSVRLFEGTPESLAEVAVEDLPGSLAETLGVDRSAGFLNLRTLSAGGGAALFHGHGAAESKKPDLLRFFREVDRALWQILRDESVPLVLAGVAYYLPLYREASRYRNLLERSAEGSFDDATPEELHARVWPIVAETFARRLDEALAARAHAASRGLVTDDLAAIGRTAVHGRVRRLLLAEGARVWGRLDPDTGALRLAPQQQDATDDDVLDDLAESVIVRGGDVLAVPRERLPGATVASAVLRW
jgi:hypothetical protein